MFIKCSKKERLLQFMEENIRSIWDEFRSELLYFIKVKVKDEYAAEDILQEVFIKVYKNVDQIEAKKE
jgi:DNA-directed RNA polymerase specialized sigma subunit, sigma24 homolog